MGRDIGTAMHLHATRRTQERMAVSSLPQECNEGTIWAVTKL